MNINSHKAHVIVVGNEKGGSGKSTTSMHVTVALLRMGYRVAGIDLDSRQGSFSRYFLNRHATIQKTGVQLPMPTFKPLENSPASDKVVARIEEEDDLNRVLDAYHQSFDVVVIDTPGSDSYLARCGHSHADTLITPLNDSLVDLDVLAKVDPETMQIAGPSHYAEMVWQQKMVKAKRDGGTIDWVVMRNRMTHMKSHNKEQIARLLNDLSERVGFRLAPGFGERTIFRELFLKGLTLMDLKEIKQGTELSMSHVAARQEVRALIDTIGIRPPETL